ncbi:uncharacterized protein JCM6883_001380 [Sporobolomyces salmoneus]|uniref:uncharacterized protein n=1 Tax=Sporobolomyces salmoneus TaxID=183962 RepID=UPI00317800D8
MSTTTDSIYNVSTINGPSELSHVSGQALCLMGSKVNLALPSDGSSALPPENFKLNWRSTLDSGLNHRLALVRFHSGKACYRIPTPNAPPLEGSEGEVPFSSAASSELANWIRTLRDQGCSVSASLVIRRMEHSPDCGSLVVTGSSAITHYIQNNVVFLFPPENEGSLWSKSSVLVKSSPYFKTLFDSEGFAETNAKLEAPELRMDTLVRGAIPDRTPKTPHPSTATAAIVNGVKQGGGGAVEKTETLTEKEETGNKEDQEEEDSVDEDSDLENDYFPSPTSSPSIHRIVVRDTAYKTLFAYLYFLETGNVYFSPLSSLLPRSHTPSPLKPSSPPSCSPKSMYRLASFYEHQTLRELAYKSISAQLDCRNALMELFSDLSADYEEIKSLCVEAVLDNWSYVKDSKQMKDLETDLRDGVLEERKVGLVFELFAKLKPATS